jgi:adenylyltransferase/sulfurtransferase
LKLSSEEKELYNRQISFLQEERQEKLKENKILVLGAGGLGSPILYYTAAAGIGEIIICDFDTVSLSNLNRQIIHNYNRVGQNKAKSAEKTLQQLNPYIKITTLTEKISLEQLCRIAANCDLVVEATDDMAHKEEVNRFLMPKGIDCIHAIVVGMGGFCFLSAKETTCLNCLFKKAPVFTTGRALPFDHYPSFGATAGCLGSLIGIISIHYLLGHKELVTNKIFYLSQFFRAKKLQLSARGLRAIMTDHFKHSFQKTSKRFPENDTLITEHHVTPDPECEICK